MRVAKKLKSSENDNHQSKRGLERVESMKNLED